MKDVKKKKKEFSAVSVGEAPPRGAATVTARPSRRRPLGKQICLL